MTDTESPLFSKMRSLYGSMSKSEQRIANFFFGDSSLEKYLTLSELATVIGTSESTIVRFSRKLDYSGFAAFKRALLSDALSHQSKPTPNMPYANLGSGDDTNAVRHKLLTLMQSALADTLNNIDPSIFNKVTHLIAAAEHINLFANNQSGHIAQIAAHKFMAMGINVSARTDRLLHQGYAKHLSSADVAIFLSHSGKPEDLLEALEIAKRREVPTVAITSSRKSPVAQYADFHLLTSLPVATVGDEAGVIRIAQIALLDCLAISVVHLKQNRDT